ncbi:MAG TPA: VTT domain-containing protein [Ktedonobacterales bacterium]
MSALASLPPAGVYLFLFVWLFVESTGFPISDEPVLLLAGLLVATHRLDLTLAIVTAASGKVLASCLAYLLGQTIPLRRIVRPQTQPATGLSRWLWYLRPSPTLATGTERFFVRWGFWSVFLGRLIPIVRSFISYPAGLARMPFALFLAATSAGSLLWITTWLLLGAGADRLVRQWRLDGWLVVAVLGLIFLATWLWHARRKNRQPNVRRKEESARRR